MRTPFSDWPALCAALLIALAPTPTWAAAAIEVRFVDEAGGVRVEIASPAAYAADVLTLPPPRPRVAVDLPQSPVRVDGVSAETGAAPGRGAVTQVRFARREGGRSRIVLDLADGATLRDQRVEADTRGGRLLVLEIADPAPAAAVRASAPIERRAPPPQQQQQNQHAREAPVVVVDAGHGGRDSGAIGASGRRESDITLAAALELRAALTAKGFTVVMTREDDRFLNLFDRVRVAREARADLFISLHADASQSPGVRGASVYTLSERGGQRAQSVAAAQNWELDLPAQPRSDAANGFLLDLAQRETKSKSATFAETLVAEIEDVAPVLTNTHRNAGFAVLLAPDVPAVLLEMGFMTNAADESRLADPARRAAMMARVADAVETFLAPRLTLAQR